MPPAISILLPFYREIDTLEVAVQSVWQQTFTDYELLLLASNATPNSQAIAGQLASQHDQTQVISIASSGIVEALNQGLAHALGSQIARMDADDKMHPTRLEKQFQVLQQQPEIDLVACQVEHKGTADQSGFEHYVNWSNGITTTEALLLNRFVESPLVHPSVLFRKSCVDRWGNYRDGDFPEDYELWLRWIGQGMQPFKLPEVLLEWHDSEQRLSRTDPRYTPEAFYRTKAVYLAQWLAQHNPCYPEITVWGAGKRSRKRALLLEEQGIDITGFVDVQADKTSQRPCKHFSELPPPGKTFVVSYVSNRGAREHIRQYLLQRNYVEGKDFILAA